MAPGLEASVWSQGHQGRVQIKCAHEKVPKPLHIQNSDSNQKENRRPLQEFSLPGDTEKRLTGAHYVRIPSVTAEGSPIDKSFDGKIDVVTAQETVAHLSSLEEGTAEKLLPHAIPDRTQDSSNYAKHLLGRQPSSTNSKRESTDMELLNNAPIGRAVNIVDVDLPNTEMDPVEKYSATLDVEGLLECSLLERLAIPVHERIYPIAFMLALRSERIIPRSFIYICPGKYFEVRKGFKIALKAKEKGRTYQEAVAAERHGKFKLPETPDVEREARRGSDRDVSPITPLHLRKGMSEPTTSDVAASTALGTSTNRKRHFQESFQISPSIAESVAAPAEPEGDFVAISVPAPSNSVVISPVVKASIMAESEENSPVLSIQTQKHGIAIPSATIASIATPTEPEEAFSAMSAQTQSDGNAISATRDESKNDIQVIADDHTHQSKSQEATMPLEEAVHLFDLVAQQAAAGRNIGFMVDVIKRGLLAKKEQTEHTKEEILDTQNKREKTAAPDQAENAKSESESSVEIIVAAPDPRNDPAPIHTQDPRNEREDDPDLSTLAIVDGSGTFDQTPGPALAAHLQQATYQHGSEPFIFHAWQIKPNARYDLVLPEGERPTCQFCTSGKKYSRMNKLIDHYEEEHFWCPKCQLAFEEQEGLLRHFETDKDSHNWCMKCEQDYATLDTFLQHLKRAHPPEDEVFVCCGCNSWKGTAVGVVQHLENGDCSKTSVDLFKRARVVTALCQRNSLDDFKSLSTHEKSSIKEQSLKLLCGDNCIIEGLPLCKESAWSPWFNGNAHKIRTHTGAAWKCPYPVCRGQSYDNYDTFLDHLRAGHFTYSICPGCFKEFKLASAMLQHMIKGQRNCKLSKGSIFAHAVTALTGGYVKATQVDSLGTWRFSTGKIPPIKVIMGLPQVIGKKEEVINRKL